MNFREMENKIALVSGAAGGIGRAVARALGERGALVVAVDNRADELDTTVKELGNEDLRVEAFPADVSSSAEVEDVVDRVERQLGPIDFLVNAAGVLRVGEVTSLTDQDWATTFAVNTTGVFVVSRAVVSRMVPRASGAVVTVASNAAGTARQEMAAYAASKAAATLFTKSLGLEVAKHGIRCNVVAPGSTDTPMLTSLWNGEDGSRTSIAGVPGAFRVGIPLGKLAQPSDVADAVLFLLSENAAHITMHDLTVDGGATLGV